MREKIGPSKDEARIVLAERLKDIRQGRNPELRRIKPVLFADHAREVIDKHYAHMRCHPWAKGEIEKRLIPYFGETYLMGITPLMISGYMAQRKHEGVKPRTINGERAVLSKVMSLAVDWEWVHENPVRRVKEVEELEGPPRYLTHDEADRLIVEAHPRMKPIIITALETGGRRGEVLSLEWDHVKLSRGILYFDRASTKSGRHREIPLTSLLHQTLTELAQGKVRAIHHGRVFGPPRQDPQEREDGLREGEGPGEAGKGRDLPHAAPHVRFVVRYAGR